MKRTATLVIEYLNEIEDYRIFPGRPLEASPRPFRFQEAAAASSRPGLVLRVEDRNRPLDEFLESLNTIAFLIIKDDTLVYEKYFDGHTADSISMSFSVTEALFSALMGIAIDEGNVRSLEQPVTDYVPELTSRGFARVKLKHLLQMTSGMRYEDRGLFNNPFGKQSRLS